MHTSVVHPQKLACLVSARRAAARAAQPRHTAGGARVPQTPHEVHGGGG